MVESTVCREEKIKEISLIVHKAVIDPSNAKSIVERQKNRYFAKLGFLKPKHEDIDCESVSLYYEPLHVIQARYYVDYYKKNTYTIKIDKKVSEVIIFGQRLMPESLKRTEKILKRSYKKINLDAQERIIHEASAYVAQDRTGREIDPGKLPLAPSLPEPEKALAEYGEKARKPAISPEKLTNVLRERIVRKPSETERIVEEVFEVTENTVIYTPIYEARCRYLKTGEIKIIPISGVTGKTFYP